MSEVWVTVGWRHGELLGVYASEAAAKKSPEVRKDLAEYRKVSVSS